MSIKYVQRLMMFSIDRYIAKSIRFVVAGIANTCVIYILYLGFIYIGLHYNLALALDYLIGTITGYLANRYWTFVSKAKISHSFPRYCITMSVTYLINFIILNLLVCSNFLGPVVGQLLALGVVVIFSFLLQNFWVFKRNLTTTQRLGL